MHLRQVLCMLLIIISSPYLSAENGWTVGQLSSTDASVGIFLTYNPTTSQILGTWIDTGNVLKYSFYTDGSGWSPAQDMIPGQQGFFLNVVPTTYNSATQQYTAIWTDLSTVVLTTATYDGTSWNLLLPGIASNINFSPPTISYDPLSNKLVALWRDTTPFAVFYADYPSMGPWGPSIEAGPPPSANNGLIATAYGAATGLMAAWVDFTTFQPQFMTYDGTFFNPELPIDTTLSACCVTLTYNSATQTMFALWPDISGILYTAQYSSGAWTPATPLPGATSAEGPALGYDDINNIVYATWIDNGTGNPTFSTYQNGAWSAPLAIDSTATAASPTFLTYDAAAQKMVVSYRVGNIPYYATFIAPGEPVAPVSNLVGRQLVNNFGTVSERFNRISWTPGVVSGYAGYYLARNGTRIATLSAGQTVYDDHNRIRGIADTYTVIAFDINFAESSPVSVTVG